MFEIQMNKWIYLNQGKSIQWECKFDEDGWVFVFVGTKNDGEWGMEWFGLWLMMGMEGGGEWGYL